jgi:hypothetical protein
MSRLVRERFDRRFQDLMALGRAKIPALAPAWTDHNAHDPGITLMELLAWVSEAQLYAAGHVRRDARGAFAALMALPPGGTQPARGLLWPDARDPRAPGAIFAESVVIDADADVVPVDAEGPRFHPTHKVLWIPGTVARIATRRGDGKIVDHTAWMRRAGPAFLPFGESGARDVLLLDFDCRGEGGVFPPRRLDAKDAYWAIGVRADGTAPPPDAEPATRSPLRAAVLVDGMRTDVPIISDTSRGMLRTGVLLLDLGGLAGSPCAFTLELRAPRGLARPARVVRIEPNVLPIEQGGSVPRELHVSTGLPDWSFRLDVPGLRFDPGASPLVLETDERDGKHAWTQRDDLEHCGPDDHVYAFDPTSDTVRFGNGVNGRMPPRGVQVVVAYRTCDGVAGSVARNRKWRVEGFPDAFGVNPEAVEGGGDAARERAHRFEARRRVREDHALVSAADIVAAALALPLLEVARAWVVPAKSSSPHDGAVVLVAMRAPHVAESTHRAPETRRWREAIRRALAPRMPLGTRLIVVGPTRVPCIVRATVEAVAGLDVATVERDILDALQARLASTVRRAGVPVSKRDVGAWIRLVDGVARLVSAEVVGADGRAVDVLQVPRNGLPTFDRNATTVQVTP